MNKKFKIFDIVLFENNYDLLNLRILEFNHVVDHFVIIPLSSEFDQGKVLKSDKITVTKLNNVDADISEFTKSFIKENFESFEDLIFFSKEDELPDYCDLESIIYDIKFRNIHLEHHQFCWNTDYLETYTVKGSYVTNFSRLLTSPLTFSNLWKEPTINTSSNYDKILCGWKFKNFHSPIDSETFARENLLPEVNYSPTNTYMLEKRPINFKIPKNIGILAYHKIGRENMKRHLFLVESSNSVNLNEISKLYDTVSIIEFSDSPNEVIAENIGDSVYKSILHLPPNVLYGGKPLKDFQEDYKKNEVKKIIETVFPQDQDNIRIIYKGFDDLLGLWLQLKNEKFSEIINPS